MRIYHRGHFQVNEVIHLDQAALHHLMHVMRAKTGMALTLFNGDGKEYQGFIEAISKKVIQVKITCVSDISRESSRAVHLAQGIAKGEKMDFIIQKAVELGVNEITPLHTAFGNVKLDKNKIEKRIERWQSIIIHACEQSGRNILPKIHSPCELREWLSYVRIDNGFVFSPSAVQTLPHTLPTNQSITLLLGPEGGLSEEEIKATCEVGFKPIKLGPRILRTETATIATISVCQKLYGDF